MDGKELNIPSIEIRLLSVAALAILSFNDTIFPSLSICLKVKQHENIVKTKNIEITKLNRLENLNAVNYLGKERNSKWLASGQDIKTDFIKLDKNDIILFFENFDNGFSIYKNGLNSYSNYKRETNSTSSPNINITNQERQNDDLNTTVYNNDNIYYFLKATNNNDIIKYLINTKII